MIIHNNSMAPELFTHGNANNTVDVYSFGCIILEILTNHIVRFNRRDITPNNIGDFVAEGLRPNIPSYIPDSNTHYIDMNHRVETCNSRMFQNS